MRTKRRFVRTDKIFCGCTEEDRFCKKNNGQKVPGWGSQRCLWKYLKQKKKQLWVKISTLGALQMWKGSDGNCCGLSKMNSIWRETNNKKVPIWYNIFKKWSNLSNNPRKQLWNGLMQPRREFRYNKISITTVRFQLRRLGNFLPELWIWKLARFTKKKE